MGPISPGRWQFTQFLYRIGAMSFVNVGVLGAWASAAAVAASTATAAAIDRSIGTPLARLDNYKGYVRGAGGVPQLALLAALAFARHLAAGAPRFAEADRDGLFPARHLLARASRSQRAVLAFVHRPFDLLLRFLAVLRHADRK